ncbi:MAG: hypothetical protein AABY22_16520 [Nanoarchaeota archaeon]
MKVYKIWCEWDMGFDDLYSTKEKAQKVIDDQDWEGLVGMSLEDVKEDNLVAIEVMNVEE